MGAFIILGGILVYMFLAAYPEDVGFSGLNGSPVEAATLADDVETQISKDGMAGDEQNTDPRFTSGNRRSVGLLEACLIRGVIPFALCLFFAKLVAYTFLYWLPFYLSHTDASLNFLRELVGGGRMSNTSKSSPRDWLDPHCHESQFDRRRLQ
ncbi:putative glycerol-3-phosphate transporter 4 [Forsythia ovata]|uniref:Glycerol-3-phosphate transporter 4 n=1 Tax=Forsythia ovata TaxID=205694 RepID=A0ABD1WF94_9LAMI